MPAPTKLIPDLQKRICDLVRVGHAPYVAARLCGVHHSTHYDWMERGESGEEVYSEYSEAVKKAESESEELLLAEIRKHAAGIEVYRTKEVVKPTGVEVTSETKQQRSWQAAAWILERRFPERWKNKELTAEEAIKVLAKALLSGDEDVARQLREAVAAAAKQPSA